MKKWLILMTAVLGLAACSGEEPEDAEQASKEDGKPQTEVAQN